MVFEIADGGTEYFGDVIIVSSDADLKARALGVAIQVVTNRQTADGWRSCSKYTDSYDPSVQFLRFICSGKNEATALKVTVNIAMKICHIIILQDTEFCKDTSGCTDATSLGVAPRCYTIDRLEESHQIVSTGEQLWPFFDDNLSDCSDCRWQMGLNRGLMKSDYTINHRPSWNTYVIPIPIFKIPDFCHAIAM